MAEAVATWPEELSEHWSFREAIHSATADALGIDNTPPISLLPNAMALVALAEAARAHLGKVFGHEVVLDTDSGFRCIPLNVAVHGSGAKPGEKPSAHTRFLAFDLRPRGINLGLAFAALKASSVAFDKLILETNGVTTWLHLQAAAPGQVARRLTYTGTKGPNGSTFRSV
jgi:hypothetical protein